MKSKLLLVIAFMLTNITFSFTWGFFAHKKINKQAVYLVPESMNSFFLKYIDKLEEKSVDADKRRYSDENEAPKHYIDIDHYSVDSPFVVMPRHKEIAIEKYSFDILVQYGILHGWMQGSQTLKNGY